MANINKTHFQLRPYNYLSDNANNFLGFLISEPISFKVCWQHEVAQQNQDAVLMIVFPCEIHLRRLVFCLCHDF